MLKKEGLQPPTSYLIIFYLVHNECANCEINNSESKLLNRNVLSDRKGRTRHSITALMSHTLSLYRLPSQDKASYSTTYNPEGNVTFIYSKLNQAYKLLTFLLSLHLELEHPALFYSESYVPEGPAPCVCLCVPVGERVTKPVGRKTECS